MTVADHGSAARRALPYAVSLLALAAAAGCTASSPPSPPSSAALTTTATNSTASAAVTTTATATPSVDPVIAKIPAAARPETIEGAAAFVRYYFEALNRAFRDADPSTIDGLFTSACTMCGSLAQGVSDVRSAGNHYGGDLARVKFAAANEFTPSSRKVLISLDQVSVPIINSSGETVDKTRTAELSFLATLTYDKRWFITRLQKAKS